MHDTQGRDRDPAQWHYADPRGHRFGPYPAAALVRLFQFGHIHLETPVWCGDPRQARPLRDCTATFEIGPGSRIRLLPGAPAAGPVHPPAGTETAAQPARAEGAGSRAAKDAPAAGPPAAAGDRDRPPASGARTGPAPALAPTSRRRVLAIAIAAAVLAVTAVALRFAT
ncbi:GYF domain-containing protein [Luteimonas sp. RD2P54]|uniref:GYF domain-containing protein n=1 Tax=Luteimonas endophytica TaxID=3042023 RepID=A0ABT6J543_9GAMM|nr:GYF domain-containing protein [Luteimonas endophytica]MDH5821939.1 GYF domain-containing protein [Luteimonas endophytica]